VADLDPCSASAVALARALRERRASSLELVEACLARVERVNPALNAVVTLCADQARREASAADAEAARGDWRGPLHGVPITVKDSFDVAGVVSTWGTPGRAGFVPEADATAVARLRAAGAIVLGKTNTPELTMGFETSNPIHGRARNPYDPARTPGGSSGGAAAIVAAGGAPLDVGSDTGGSIRLPAHCCGVAGLRPTSGRVPRTGHAIGPGGALDALTQIGPIARRVEDLALALRLIAGPDGRDPFVSPVPLGEPARIGISGLRVALFVDNGIAKPDPEVEAAVTAAGQALEAAGARVDERRPPGADETLDLFMRVQLMDGGAELRSLLARCGTRLGESSLAALAQLPAPPVDDRVRTVERWDAFRARLLAWVRDWDLVVSPVCAHAALRHGESDGRIPAFSYTMTWNLTGWPGVVVRAGTSPEALPIGVQLVAPPWREDLALAAAARVEQALGGWRPPAEAEASE
jgi:amidase